MRVGLFGGSFDPPHAGHVAPVRAAQAALDLDCVYFLPTANPPHKPGPRFAPAHARFAMVELALLHEEDLYASAHELTPGQTSYTIDTLEHFRRERPGDELVYLLGSDAMAGLATWRRWRELAELAHLGVLPRPGWDRKRLERDAPAEVVALFAERSATFLETASVDSSSTELRAALARGASPAPGLIAPLVLDYIRKYSLYR